MTRKKQSPADPKKRLPEDDGRAIADMNVDGMPWSARPSGFGRRKTGRGQAEIPDRDMNDPPLTDREARNLMLQSVVAALVIALIFLTAIFLFILFSLHIWLR